MKFPEYVPYIILALILMIANLLVGSISIAPMDVFLALTGEGDAATRFIVMESRLPQMLTATLAGMALAASGLVMQTVFSNPLADPSILGVNAGASLGVAMAMLFLGGSFSTVVLTLSGFALTISSAFIGAMLVIALLVFFSSRLKNGVLLLIAGVMISYVVSSAISLLSFYATAQGVHSYVIWGLGNFSGVTLKHIIPFALSILCLLKILHSLTKPLNALLLGEDYATNLGFNIRVVRTGLLVVTGLLTAIITAFCGPIAFIGMVAPHTARFFLNTSDHKRLFPCTTILGAVIALLCQLISVLPAHGIIPINALTPLLGVPVVLMLICRRH